MSRPVFKRKIYNEILEWKVNRSDKYALLIKGARRVGKSTIAEEFAKNEFKSYILIDFANTSRAIIDLFDDNIKKFSSRKYLFYKNLLEKSKINFKYIV